MLATVVRTEGSTYRRIGARLVALEDGSHVGAVSAGCIETDVILRAEKVRAAGTAELVTYDTRSPDDLLWGSGTGCGGLTELLLEPLDPGQALSQGGAPPHRRRVTSAKCVGHRHPGVGRRTQPGRSGGTSACNGQADGVR